MAETISVSRDDQDRQQYRCWSVFTTVETYGSSILKVSKYQDF